jgi:uncharacterized tellurite resistance protein B-like protein
MKDRIGIVADLLMGSAYADNRLEGEEKAAVRRLLRETLGTNTLPMDLEFRIEEFKPEGLDLGQAGAAFASEPLDIKRRLLELLAAVHSADDEYDFAEDEYLARVGKAMGVAEKDYQDLLAIVLEEVDLAEDLRLVREGK